MYIRFIAPWRELRRGVHAGLFGPAYTLARDRETPESLRAALWHEIGWFERELPVPKRRDFCVRSRKRWVADGICWFRDESREMIARAHGLAGLLDACGVPVVPRVTHRPGQILYRDAWQIVAKPEEATPTRWA